MFGIEFLWRRSPSATPNLDHEWPAEQLPHPDTTLFEAGEAFTNSLDRRMLTYGPFVSLDKGYYGFTIVYRSPAATHHMSGFWDITTEKGTKVLDRGPLLGTLGEASTLKVMLFIDRKQSDVEFRTYSESAGAVFIKSIRIQRLEDRQR